MRIGYPCINRSMGCTPNNGFILKNYSEENLKIKTALNLACLNKILEFNHNHGLFFFRLSSDLIPFASHPVMKFNWQKHFAREFGELGKFATEKGMRLSLHPDQFVLLNSLKEDIFGKSLADLKWHCEALDLMGLSEEAKVQIHVGGVYGDKKSASERFVRRYSKLPAFIRKRLVIENDDRLYSAADCLAISRETGIPVVFDYFHFQCLNEGQDAFETMKKASKTWQKKDGPMMVDYSSQETGRRKGAHTETLDEKDFINFLKKAAKLDMDIMLEIKDKEKSAIKAAGILKNKKLLNGDKK